MAVCFLLLPVFVYAQTENNNDDFVLEQIKTAKKAIRTQNFSRAFSLYESAAASGNAEAQYQLSNLLILGTGAPKNQDLAESWLEKSALQNHPAALYHLAILIKGKDPQRAQELIQQAGNLNYAPALNYIKQRGGDRIVNTNLNEDETTILWFGAARKDSASELQQFKDSGQDVNQQDNAERTALFTAIESNSPTAIDWLLVNKANPNHKDKFGNTPLYIAARMNDKTTFNKLIKHGADIQQTLPNDDNLWHYTIRLDQIKLTDILFQKKVDINKENKDGWTPLDLAEYKEQLTLAEQIKQHGGTHGSAWSNQTNAATKVTADKFFKSNGGKQVTLAETAKIVLSGNTELVKIILENQPNIVNQPLHDRSTLLLMATYEKNIDMVTTLLKSNADTNLPGKNGITALHIAARLGLVEILDTLLQYQASPSQSDNEGNDAIDWAIQLNQENTTIHLINSLKSKGIPLQGRYLLNAAKNNSPSLVAHIAPNLTSLEKNDLGRTALWYSAYHSSIEMINATRRLNNQKAADSQGKTPFFIAVEKNCFECAKLLFATEDINHTTESGHTALMAAAENANPEIVQWLISNNADLEMRTSAGNSALILATESHSLPVVKLLVNAKAKISRRNKLGFSALDIAEEKDPEIYTFLKKQTILGIF